MSVLRATTISDLAGTGPATLTGQYAAKAWVNFDGTGAVAIRQSGNVSSITDNGTGDYTVNFTTALTDANYISAGTSLHIIGANNYLRGWQPILTPTATSFRINNSQLNTGGLEDSQSLQVAVFR